MECIIFISGSHDNPVKEFLDELEVGAGEGARFSNIYKSTV